MSLMIVGIRRREERILGRDHVRKENVRARRRSAEDPRVCWSVSRRWKLCSGSVGPRFGLSISGPERRGFALSKVVVVGYLRQRFDMEDNWKLLIPDAVIQFALVFNRGIHVGEQETKSGEKCGQSIYKTELKTSLAVFTLSSAVYARSTAEQAIIKSGLFYLFLTTPNNTTILL